MDLVEKVGAPIIHGGLVLSFGLHLRNRFDFALSDRRTKSVSCELMVEDVESTHYLQNKESFMVEIDPPTFEERLDLRKVASPSVDRVLARVTLVRCPRHDELGSWVQPRMRQDRAMGHVSSAARRIPMKFIPDR